MLKVLLGCMVTNVSKKGSDPCCVDSTVNWMWGSWLLMCGSRSWLCSALLMTLFPNISSNGKYTCHSQTPLSPYLQLDLQQLHLGKFSLYYLLV